MQQILTNSNILIKIFSQLEKVKSLETLSGDGLVTKFEF